MKKIFIALTVFLTTGTIALAQDTFTPAWFLEAKGGAAWTAGQSSSFGDLISPNAAFSFGYGFIPGFSLRGDISGWQGKGALVSENSDGVNYKFNYVQLAADAMWDICNSFNYKASRIANPYIFGGLGFNMRFNNKEAQGYLDIFPVNNNLWNKGVLSFMGRVGAGVEFKINSLIGIELEVVDNLYSDKFNSLKGHTFDHHIAGLVGVKFTLGGKKNAAPVAAAAPAEPVAEKAAPVAEKAEPVAEKAEPVAEKAEPVAEPVEKVVEEPKVDLAAEKAAAEKATAERAAARATSQTLLYKSQHKDVDETHAQSIKAIVDVLNKFPEAVVTVTGYSDKATGTAEYNLNLSQKRAENVAKALTEAGIAQERITVKWVGDTESISESYKENRAVVCVTK